MFGGCSGCALFFAAFAEHCMGVVGLMTVDFSCVALAHGFVARLGIHYWFMVVFL